MVKQLNLNDRCVSRSPVSTLFGSRNCQLSLSRLRRNSNRYGKSVNKVWKSDPIKGFMCVCETWENFVVNKKLTADVKRREQEEFESRRRVEMWCLMGVAPEGGRQVSSRRKNGGGICSNFRRFISIGIVLQIIANCGKLGRGGGGFNPLSAGLFPIWGWNCNLWAGCLCGF